MEIIKFILCIAFTFLICKSVLFCLENKKTFNKNKIINKNTHFN